MTFQLYDLKGMVAETGSFETWWAAPGSERTVVHLDGLNEDGSAPAGADAVLVRDSYLVRQLLESAVHPVPKMQAAEEMTTRKLKYGKDPIGLLWAQGERSSGNERAADDVLCGAADHGRSDPARARG